MTRIGFKFGQKRLMILVFVGSSSHVRKSGLEVLGKIAAAISASSIDRALRKVFGHWRGHSLFVVVVHIKLFRVTVQKLGSD